MKKISHLILKAAMLFSILIAHQSFSQVTTVSGVTATQLVNALVANPGVVILNAQITGAPGSYGTFANGNTTNLGMNSGIVLSSGSVVNIPSTNTIASYTTQNGFLGDPLLDAITTPNFTEDACRLEFDIVAYDTVLTFNYVFASEEYNDFVNTGFNDAFGFFISGPGIVGQQNIALIPGTTTPVTINNVNCGLNGSYYVCNDIWNQFSGNCTNQCPTNAGQTSIEYDGFTTQLTAIAHVTACDTFHLILVVADVGDQAYDSDVFLSNLVAGTNLTVIVNDTIPNYPPNTIVEGCTQGTFHIAMSSGSGASACAVLDTTVANCLANDTLCFLVVMSGNAIEGIDYQPVPDTMCMVPGVPFIDINIIPIVDGTFEPPFDSIIVDLTPLVDTTSMDTCQALLASGALGYFNLHGVMLMMDEFLTVSADDTICNGQGTQLSAQSNFTNYSWSPTATLVCPTCAITNANPTTTTTYAINVSMGPCAMTDSTVITVIQPSQVIASAGGSICKGDSIQISASGNGITSYHWTPTATVGSPNSSSTWAFPNNSTTYTVTGTSTCGNSTDTVHVIVNPQPIAFAFPDTCICPGESVMLHASGGTNYAWLTPFNLSATNIPNPIATPTTAPETFIVAVYNSFGCIDSASVTVCWHPLPDANAGQDVTILLGDTTQLFATGGVSYSWFPTNGLTNPNISNPFASPQQTTTYTVTVTSLDGCTSTDTVIVNVHDEPTVYLPNAFSPNGDDHNDVLHIIHFGIFKLGSFAIYNRWGQKVFETSDINEGWDGTFEGLPQEVGVYVYFIEGAGYNGVNVSLKGNITLIR